ncbi:flagellin lysine-N-methylase [Bacillus sp. B15-48]|uniref:flagellin lysine-N-methylase n=1 Tax=Bacillus sp. B15-48 TaxID=1548601 RepID=UPI00193F9A3C|nr:hypothetical protein [Bacillus sp. B15-48]
MTLKTVDALVPEYLKHFSCIGSDCEDTCCAGWRVTIDDETYKKYKRVKHTEMKKRLEKNIVRNRSNPSKNNAAKINMYNLKCPFLDKDSLCDIHSKLGEEYLSDTCKFYPRVDSLVNGILERSLTLSCPEAARLVLLNRDGIKFETGKNIKTSINTILKSINSNMEEITHWTDLFNEFRYITIYILQYRKVSLVERLFILGMLYNEIEEAINKGNITSIPDILGKYLNSLEIAVFEGAFNNISNRLDIQLQLSREIAILRLKEGISSTRYLDCSREMIAGLKINEHVTDEELKQIYEEAYREYYFPFMEDHDYILENYLVNYVFKNCMPIDSITPFESFSKMILHYSLIKLHLVGMANYHKGLSINLVIKLIQSISKTYEHNGMFFYSIMGLMKEKEYMTLPFMSFLIKN